jgi:hypothetical protein
VAKTESEEISISKMAACENEMTAFIAYSASKPAGGGWLLGGVMAYQPGYIFDNHLWRRNGVAASLGVCASRRNGAIQYYLALAYGSGRIRGGSWRHHQPAISRKWPSEIMA